jgi:uncharacterized protein (TIGR02147 family)
MQSEHSLQYRLSEYFKAMRVKNSAYSLRSMARSFDTSPAQLSQILSGKRPMTNKFAFKVADKLGLSPLELREALTEKIGSRRANADFTLLAEENFKIIADWHHLAILSLSQVPDAKADCKWIAQRLGIDYHEAKAAFDRLRRLKFIEIKNGSYHQVPKPMHTTNDVPSGAIRKYHKQNLELAARKIDDVGVEDREYSAITVAANPKKLAAAKKMIRQFKTDLAELLETGPKEEVYTLSIQLFPVSKLRKTLPRGEN